VVSNSVSKPEKQTSVSSRKRTQALGISAISTFKPDWILGNDWFESIPRKFAKHTGILERPVSEVDEVSLAVEAVNNLVAEYSVDLKQCAAVIFSSPSFVPLPIAKVYLDEQRATNENLDDAAQQFVDKANLQPRQLLIDSTYCAGYATALSRVLDSYESAFDLAEDEFVLVVTASRISRITDYSCRQTAGLFGDLATATVVSRMDSEIYPVHFQLLDASVELQPTNRPFFNFLKRQDV